VVLLLEVLEHQIKDMLAKLVVEILVEVLEVPLKLEVQILLPKVEMVYLLL
jgi:hypothetical protein